ncbi:MAG: HD domain-containing protein [Nitrospirae bacterium]|nr:MAG: HD domain-containing protein [Nitrospirota bacterium]
MRRCPGQDKRFWQIDSIFNVKCPKCGYEIEFFKDDTSRICRKCGAQVLNPKMDFGCASYCKYAQQCLGSLPPELIAKRKDLLKDRVAIEVKKHFVGDFKTIGHILRVVKYAEELCKKEGKGDLGVILLAVYLHEIGKPLKKDSAEAAAEILTRLGVEDAMKDDVCSIIEHLNRKEALDDENYKILSDAHMLASIEEGRVDIGLHEIDHVMFTKHGLLMAKEMLLRSK